jgi:serine/threonine-protein kinase
MSRVFVAEEKALARRVVIKVLHPTLAATVSAERFEREILLVAALNHPNIVPVLSAGEVDRLPYFIMPFIDGESLRARVTRGPLSVREALGVLKDVARALAYAHNAGVVHRDIKPANILLSGSAAMVADFGVAKAVSAARDRGVVARSGEITGIGISLGTPQYMAPEQAAADPNADHRVDIYALGIVAYEILTGSPPFHGRTPQALLAAQLTELPMPVSARRYDVPVGVAELVMRCLEKNPADRPKSAQELARALESPDTIAGPVATPARAIAARRKRLIQNAAYYGIPAVIAIAAAAWGLRPERPAGDAAVGAGPTAAAGGASPAVASVAPGAPVASGDARITLAVVGDGAADVANGIVAALEPALGGAGLRVTVVRGTAPGATSGLDVGLTVQRQGAQARATVRLAQGAGATLWSERFDFATANAFTTQDSIVARTLRAVRAARR